MAKGSSKSGGGGAKPQVATKALVIDNMNEAQLNAEIAKTEAVIARAERTMNKNSITNSANAKALAEQFPLGVGGDGWSKDRIRARDAGLERDARKAKDYTEAYEQKRAAETRLTSLQNAKKQVAGTGKTLSEIKQERQRKAISETPKTLSWKTTQKSEWKNGTYRPKIIKAGNLEIHGEDGLYTVYKDGKMVGRTSKLSAAKAVAERIK